MFPSGSRRLKPRNPCGEFGRLLQELGAVTLPDADGTPHPLGDYWADRAVILVFLRHFG